MRKIKNIIAAIAAATFLSSTGNTIHVTALSSQVSFINYLNMVIPVYLADIAGYGSKIAISNPIVVSDKSDSVNKYVVFADDLVVGMLTVGEENGEYYSSFDSNTEDDELYSSLQKSYDNGESITISVADGAEIVLHEDDVSITSETEVVRLDELNTLNVDIVSTDSSLYYIQLDTTVVKNYTNPDNGKGLCWAAAIATKFNYEENTTMPISYILWVLKNKYGEIPIGTPTWILRMYNYLYGNNVVKREEGMMTYAEITRKLQNDTLIHIDLARDNAAGHSVVISGIKIYNGYALYYIDDPNKSGHQSIYVSSDTMNATADLVYYTSTESSTAPVYTRWVRSYCQ